MGHSEPRPVVRISSTQRAMRVPRRRVERLVRFVARRRSARVAEVDVAIVSAREMAALNRRHLGHGGATDVLSFDLSDGADLCAQVIVCADIAVREAKSRPHGPQRELLLYVLHGLLHLLGFDDRREADARRMRALQERLLEDYFRAERLRAPDGRRRRPPRWET